MTVTCPVDDPSIPSAKMVPHWSHIRTELTGAFFRVAFDQTMGSRASAYGDKFPIKGLYERFLYAVLKRVNVLTRDVAYEETG